MFVTKGEPLRNGRFPVTSRQPVLLVVSLRSGSSSLADFLGGLESPCASLWFAGALDCGSCVL
jgi:hypothetical protein